MGCYLCSYLRSETPEDPQPLPAGSPAHTNDPLGTCHRCFVAACAEHATRYSWFECAICTPALAAGAALTGQPVGDAATAQAHLVGSLASSSLRGSASATIDRLAAEGGRPVAVRANLAARGTGEPNLVTNLAETIRGLTSDDDDRVRFLAAPDRYERVSYDAIGAAVRTQFGGQRIQRPDDFAATVVAGALIMAYRLADPAFGARHAQGAAGDVEPRLPPPWEVRHPTLLDPTMWMISTAYTIEQT